MKVICQKHTWINIHIYAISYLIRGDLFLLFVWLICGAIQEKCQHFRTTLCFAEWWRMQRGLEAKASTCVCFLSSQISWSGGSGVPWHFLFWGVLFIWPKDSAQSHQPTATKHIGLRRKGSGETTFSFSEGHWAQIWHFVLINELLFNLITLILDQNSYFCQSGDI